jgi:hypothetical protein
MTGHQATIRYGKENTLGPIQQQVHPHERERHQGAASDRESISRILGPSSLAGLFKSLVITFARLQVSIADRNEDQKRSNWYARAPEAILWDTRLALIVSGAIFPARSPRPAITNFGV